MRVISENGFVLIFGEGLDHPRVLWKDIFTDISCLTTLTSVVVYPLGECGVLVSAVEGAAVVYKSQDAEGTPILISEDIRSLKAAEDRPIKMRRIEEDFVVIFGKGMVHPRVCWRRAYEDIKTLPGDITWIETAPIGTISTGPVLLMNTSHGAVRIYLNQVKTGTAVVVDDITSPDEEDD